MRLNDIFHGSPHVVVGRSFLNVKIDTDQDFRFSNPAQLCVS